MEHAYKYIIANNRLGCTHNCFKYVEQTKIRDMNSPNGKFYTEDCPCDRVYCRIINNLKHKAKAELLYVMLPVFTVISQDHIDYIQSLGVSVSDNDHVTLQSTLQNFYNNVSASVGGTNILIDL